MTTFPNGILPWLIKALLGASLLKFPTSLNRNVIQRKKRPSLEIMNADYWFVDLQGYQNLATYFLLFLSGGKAVHLASFCRGCTVNLITYFVF